MGKIKALPPEVVAKIAAGEVVERPASVVKELVENSLDAGSREIKIEVQAGGRKLIRVSDDGEGMTRSEALLAIQRYSTSKIEKEEDLWAISTFGFRGEALAAIAAVSRMKITTKKEKELTGVAINIEGGKVKEVEEVGCPPGTSVEVRDLFFNIPARLKFLKSPGTELGHIGDLIVRMALANPEEHFQFLSDGKLMANYPVRGDLWSRLAEAFGREAAEKLYPFQAKNGEIEIKGFSGEPGLTKSNAREIYLFVNRRPVRDRLLIHAVIEAYRQLIPKDRYPLTVLFVTVPPGMVDVNVHPSKGEVKFADSALVHHGVVLGVRKMLGETPWLKKGGEEKREFRESIGLYTPPKREDAFASKPPEFFQLETRQEPVTQTPFIGQVANTYLLFATDGLTLVDQHAAQERILLEKLEREFTQGSISTQSLLFPELLELPFDQAKAIEERLDDLERMGFAVQPCGPRTFWVKAVPEILSDRDPLSALKEMSEQITTWEKEADFSKRFEALIKIMACRGAVQAAQALKQEEAIELWRQLENCAFPSRCPHGRPTMVKISLTELEKMFGRK